VSTGYLYALILGICPESEARYW